MTQQRAFLVQTFLEALIPIIGYFYWKWDVTFIALFYFLDWLLTLALTLAKGRKRVGFSGQITEQQHLKKGFSLAVCLMLFSAIVAAIGFEFLLPKLNWNTRIWEFLSYTDMGLPQGLLLLPLMILNGIMIYKQQFILPAKYRTLDTKAIVQPMVRQGIVLMIVSLLFLMSTLLISYPEEIIIGTLIVGIASYRWKMRN